MFAAFAGYVLVVHAAWMTLWRRHVQIKCGLADEEPASEATPPEGVEEAHAKVEPRPATPWSSTIPPVPEGIPFWQLACSHQFLAGGFWFVANAWRSNFYLGEVKYMLRDLGDHDAMFISCFSALLVLAVPFIPLIAAATDRLGVPAAMQACTAIAAVHAAFALVPKPAVPARHLRCVYTTAGGHLLRSDDLRSTCLWVCPAGDGPWPLAGRRCRRWLQHTVHH